MDHILKSMRGCCEIGDIVRTSQLPNEVRQQQSMLSARDPFAGHSNTGVTFCCSILPMLQDLSGELEMQAKDDMYTYLVACRFAKCSGLPLPMIQVIPTASYPTSTAHPGPPVYLPISALTGPLAFYQPFLTDQCLSKFYWSFIPVPTALFPGTWPLFPIYQFFFLVMLVWQRI